MKKVLVAGVSLLALASAPALAADLPVRAPIYKAPPPVAVVYNWTGCYVGGNGGGVWIQKDYSLQAPGITAAQAAAATAAGLPVTATGAVGLGSHDVSYGIGGGQVGCNYQVGNWVFGIQGDYDWTDAKGQHALPGGLALFTTRSTTKDLASVTGRIGYAWDRFLGYVKGGGAWERDDYDVVLTNSTLALLRASETRGGWTVGVGGEYAFTDWLTGFAEYDYYDFDTRAIAFTSPLLAGFNVPVDIKERKSVFKVGLNLKFGMGKWPVAARY